MTPRDIIRLKSRQHKQDMARIRELGTRTSVHDKGPGRLAGDRACVGRDEGSRDAGSAAARRMNYNQLKIAICGLSGRLFKNGENAPHVERRC